MRPTRKIVSFVRACAAACKVRMEIENDSGVFPFLPFGPERDFFPFPCEIRCSLSLAMNEIKGMQMRPSEIK